jgi:hypothetical protein
VRGIDVVLDGETTFSVQVQQRADQGAGRIVQIAAGTWQRPGRGRPGLGQVVFRLAPHPIDLLFDDRREVLVPCGRHPPGFVREDGERRLETVREVAGLGDRPRDSGLAVFQQEIEIVDQRLNLARVGAVEAAAAPLAHVRQAPPQLLDRGHAPAHLPQAHEDGDDREDQQRTEVPCRGAMKLARELRVVEQRRSRDHCANGKQPQRPEERAEHQPRAQRAQSHAAPPMR